MAYLRKPPVSQSVAQTGTDNNLALALNQPALPQERLEAQRRLAEIAERVRLSTGADGVAIALEESDAVVCRARAGECAPSVGAFLDKESGLSGLCLRTGELIRCNDTESDERMDSFVAHVLQIRSVLALPLRWGGRVVGLIEILSRKPNAFGGREVETLRASMPDILRAMDEQIPGGDVARDRPAVASEADAAPEAVPANMPAPPNGTAEKLRALFSIAAKPEEDVATAPVAATEKAAEPGNAPTLVADAEAAPSAVPVLVDDETAPDSMPLMAGFEAASAESEAFSSSRAVLAGVAGLALLVGIGLSAWRFTNHKTPQKPPAAQAGVASSPINQLRNAAEKDDAAAQYDLAIRYLKGDGVTSSESDAAAWLLRSAHLGNSSAQLQLGVAYELGRGVPPDYVKAYACYVIAGANGNTGSDAAQRAVAPKMTQQQIADARTMLGEMYRGGIGTPVDNLQAYTWFTLAEAAGSVEGRREKASLETKLSKQQIALARRHAADWLSRSGQAR
ncbi:MAG: GAF domain-containing protein [Terriglobales bacterium]